jgi:putative Mg2+ transporter-C (MgtC) family protein
MSPADFDELHEIVIRLVLATVVGAILGIDRDLHHKPAGVRVLALVSLGAAIVVICSLTAMTEAGEKSPDSALRVVQGIIGGIGFLGGGVILRSNQSNEVHGLTTAASIWVSAALGTCCGMGQWRTAVAALAVAMLILWIGRPIEAALLRFARPEHEEPKETR